MKILVTNDDGILSQGLWTLARELNSIAPVVVVAPDREQSAIGTAVTLHQLLRAQRVNSLLPGIETYAVDGTPADSVIVAVSELMRGEVGLVVSGVNLGLNLGDDVLISGTVGAALQGYLRGIPAVAVSTEVADSRHLDKAARLAACLAGEILNGALPRDLFLNVNLPQLPAAGAAGVKVTCLASGTHTDTTEAGRDRRGAHYRIVRERIDGEAEEGTDVWAVRRGNISITPLNAYLNTRPSPAASDGFCPELLTELLRC